MLKALILNNNIRENNKVDIEHVCCYNFEGNQEQIG